MKIPVIVVMALGMAVAGCALPTEPLSHSVSYPWTGLKLTQCKAYGTFSECQLVQTSASHYQRYQLGPVQQQNRRLQTLSNDYQYQVTSCYEIQRVNRPLPNYLCRIVGYRTGADAGSVFVKGGTAVNLAKYLGDQEQLHYQRKRDPWERKGL
ncbi:hypothetical protein [Mesorhizobium denitrificans]|uniref:DUF2799 domain-containing protein n=1 Tax=Mesorhizobium denitrificans TaxID=2294114 RepID=A0A371X6E3_9HYPH|nr:hypothetical protein [Mesorhizobium denitrificans]RFC64799.1 hypothetical protein DY251_18745 [Mesorhizobium denitrificans]